jgi:N-carbamoyl-L-amino-acid hydrolase
VRGFIELHIEQGPVLVGNNASTGIVTGIRGTVRARKAQCIGAYSHSGAVPQELRQDAVLATAELINRIDQHCASLRASGKDIVFAVGRLHTDAAMDSLSKVPGEVNFTIDLRSQDETVLSHLDALLDDLAAAIGRTRNVRFEIGDRAVAEPTLMDPAFRAVLTAQAAILGISALEMPCGAGHDAAEFVRAGIPSCMIFVRNTGESHNPSEHMEMTDFRDGTLLLIHFLANGWLDHAVQQQL